MTGLGGATMIDQLLGIGGLSVLVYLVVRLTIALRAAWDLERDGELDRVLREP
ncbi:MAG: hypothetical protein ABR600_04535 [Actinomycetota bacterium]